MHKLIFILINVFDLQNLFFLAFIFKLDLVELLLAKRTFIYILCAPFLDALEAELVGAALDASLIDYFHFIEANCTGLFLFVLAHFFKRFTVLLHTFPNDHWFSLQIWFNWFFTFWFTGKSLAYRIDHFWFFWILRISRKIFSLKTSIYNNYIILRFIIWNIEKQLTFFWRIHLFHIFNSLIKFWIFMMKSLIQIVSAKCLKWISF